MPPIAGDTNMPAFRHDITYPIHCPIFLGPTVSARSASPTAYTTEADRPCKKRLRSKSQTFLAKHSNNVAAALQMSPCRSGVRREELLSASHPKKALHFHVRSNSLFLREILMLHLRDPRHSAAPKEDKSIEFQDCTRDVGFSLVR